MGVRIVGTGITACGILPDRPLRQAAGEAAELALADTGLRPEEIGLIVFSNAAAGLITGQEMIRAQTSLAGSRLAGRPTLSVENACASGSSAFHLGLLAVRSGAYEFVMVLGAEKMTSTDRTRAARALATAVDVEGRPVADPDAAPKPVFMEIYAANTRAYMDEYGATSHDLALIAAKSSRNGSLNPIAQVRTPLSPQDVLEARMIADPLTRPMCSSISDGAAAVVICSEETARRRGLRGPSVVASVLVSNGPDIGARIVEVTGEQAYEQAGVGPDDISVAEIHDAASPAELFLVEELGLCGPGEAARLVREGATDLGGRLPVNPSGGLTARGHPIGATGVAQLVELADQCRGRAGARQVENVTHAMAQNAGGSLHGGEAACVVTILAAS